MSAQRRHKEGFTLVELMLGVVIIAALTALLAPSVRRSILEQRLSAATRDFAGVIRQARLDTITMGRAHLVWIQPTNGSVRVLRGRNNSCIAQDWSTLDGQCTANTARSLGTECLEVSLSNTDYSLPLTTSLTLRERVPSGGTDDKDATDNRGLCFAPSGLSYLATGTTLSALNLSTNDTVQGGLLYRITMNRLAAASGDKAATLPPRHVLVPLSGYAKVLQ